MTNGQHDFPSRYAAMSETELMELARAYDSLVEPAQAALRAEFARRNLEPPLLDEPETIEPRDLVTIERFRDLPAADLARGLLDAAGIPAWVQDDHLVRMDWFYSNAIGGLRLQVERADAEAAREILDQPMPKTIELSDGGAFAQPQCPKCGSIEIGTENFSRGTLWLCNACGARWKEIGDPPPATC